MNDSDATQVWDSETGEKLGEPLRHPEEHETIVEQKASRNARREL